MHDYHSCLFTKEKLRHVGHRLDVETDMRQKHVFPMVALGLKGSLYHQVACKANTQIQKQSNMAGLQGKH